jgi:hypothetical protein
MQRLLSWSSGRQAVGRQAQKLAPRRHMTAATEDADVKPPWCSRRRGRRRRFSGPTESMTVVWHHDQQWRLCERQEAGAKKQSSIDGDANLGKAADVRVQRVCLGGLELLPFLSSRDKHAVPALRRRTTPAGRSRKAPARWEIECDLRGLLSRRPR